eukprot:RCo029596
MSSVDFAGIVVASLQATANIVAVCGAAAWLTRSGVLTADLSKQLSVLVMYLFNPCMVFANVGPAVDLPTLLQWWPVAAFCAIYIVLGLALGALLGAVLRLTRAQMRVAMAALAFANTTSTPLAIVESLVTTNAALLAHGPEDTESRIRSRAVALIMLMTILQTFGRWTLGSWLLSPDRPAAADSAATPVPEAEGPAKPEQPKPLAGTPSGEGVPPPAEELPQDLPADPENGEPATAISPVKVVVLSPQNQMGDALQLLPETTFLRSRLHCPRLASPWLAGWLSKVCGLVGAGLGWFRAHVVGNLNPPAVACVAALVVGLSPPLKEILFDPEDSFVAPVVLQTGLMLGDCNVPVILLTLGSRLSRGPPQTVGEVPRRFLPAVIVTKLVVVPAIILGLLVVFRKAGVISADPVLSLTLLLNNVGPSAINLLVIAGLNGFFENTIAAMHFYAYLLANASTTAWVVAYLAYLRYSA